MEFGLSSGADMGSNEDYDAEFSDPDACLNPVERLEKYVEAEHTYSRQLAARSLLETFQQVDECEDAERVLKVLLSLANDPDGVVRTELCEQLVQIGNLCHRNQKLFCAVNATQDPLSSVILPVIYRFMTDSNTQVRKTSQTALVELIEKQLVCTEEIIDKVSPIISNLAAYESTDDHRTEAATIICKLVPILGLELTDRLFLSHFLSLCSDPVFQIRKVCAVNFGAVCQVVGRKKTESDLLDPFFRLCLDSIWGVRKACTECFMQVSLICSPAVRHSRLSSMFIRLVSDQSRWVRMAAFEVLGGFISTFADPSTSGLQLTDEGTLVLADPELTSPLGTSDDDVAEADNGSESDSLKNDELHCLGLSQESHIPDDSSQSHVTNNSSQLDHRGLNNMHLPQQESVVNVVNCSGPTSETCGMFSSDADSPTDSGFLSQGVICADEKKTDENAPANSTENCRELVNECVAEEACPGVVKSDEVESSSESESVADRGVRWGLNTAEDQNANKSNAVNREVCKEASDSSTVEVNTLAFCTENALVNGHVEAVVDTSALELTLDDTLKLTAAAAEKVADEFGSLNFWQQLMNNDDNRLEPISSDVIKQCVENSLNVDAISAPDADTSCINSKLRDSISHLSNPAGESSKLEHDAETSEACASGNVGEVPHEGNHVESTDMEPEANSSCSDVEVTQSSSAVENGVTLGSSETCELSNHDPEVDDTSTVTLMECEDAPCSPEKSTDAESGSSAVTLEPGEVPLYEDSTSENCYLAQDVYKPLLEFLDESTDSDNSAMDIGEDIGLDNGIDVDEEEVRELVAAAKDLPCDDLAVYEQNVVPRDLFEQYLSMLDPSYAQKVDSEITRHCAYSLPAVAFTLGRKNWASLKNLYATLAMDVQWKVRRTLAFSIHELAMIVGEEITSRDLVPVFDGFLNDLDEVRIGVLKHLADFLKLLSSDVRHGYLMKIAELLKTDNNRNWRFREELARQLYLLTDLFTVVDIQEHIVPIAMRLADDRVAQVRLAALRVLSHILKQFVKDDDEESASKVWSSYVAQMKERFALSKSCVKRQMYVRFCDCILQDQVIACEQFAKEFLPTLLSLHRDSIPNVRLTLARTLAQHIIHSEYFTSEKNPLCDELTEVVCTFRMDRDQDVRFLIDQKPDEIKSSSVEVAE